MAPERWAPIRDFPGYEISTYGNVYSEKSGQLLNITNNTQGVPKVGLIQNGKQYTKLIRLLVADAFVEPPLNDPDSGVHISNTSLCLDLDLTNNHVSNIVWRPRWFVLKYTRVMNEEDPNHDVGPIRNIRRNKVYGTVREAAMTEGEIPNEVLLSAHSQDPVFPNWNFYEFVE